MHSLRTVAALPLALLCLLGSAAAQRHDVGSSPPTPPPPKAVVVPQVVIPDPLNTGLGGLQLTTADALICAPQLLAMQLQSTNDRLRTSALAAIGAPGQYLNPAHVAFPRSVHLDFLPLGNTADTDAILTVEFNQHLLSVILMPQDGEWHRVATATYAVPYSDASTTPSTFLHTDRSLRDRRFFTAIFHTTTSGTDGGFTDTEVHLRILNNRAAVVMSFASTQRTCDPTHQKPCDLTEQWLQPSTTDPTHEVVLVNAVGHVRPSDSGDRLAQAETYEASHLRTFTCQHFLFSDATLHFDAASDAAPCFVAREAAHDAAHDATHDATHEATHETPHEVPHDTQHPQPLH